MSAPVHTVRIEVVHRGTGQAVDVINVSSNDPEKVERGVNINLDHERYYTRIVTA